MVLPDRIELSTSPLPMECSTTELRQHAPGSRTLDRKNRPKKGSTRRGDPCHKVRGRARRGRAAFPGRRAKYRPGWLAPGGAPVPRSGGHDPHGNWRLRAAQGKHNIMITVHPSGLMMKDDGSDSGRVAEKSAKGG